MENHIEFGDAREVLKVWKDQGVKVQTCVTSPPYFGLRSYLPDGVKIKSNIKPEELSLLLLELEKLGIRPYN